MDTRSLGIDSLPALQAPGRGSLFWSGATLSPVGLPKHPFCRAWAFTVFLSLLIYSGLALLPARLGKGLRPGEGGRGPEGVRRKPGGGRRG